MPQLYNAFEEPIDLKSYQAKRICKILQDTGYEAARMNGILDILRVLGITPAYGWIGHRREWFYPTEEDIEFKFDWESSLREDG